MRKHSTATRARARSNLLVALIGVVPVAGMLGLAGQAGATLIATRVPRVQQCRSSETFVRSSRSQAFYGTGQTTWAYNYNSSSLTRTLTTSTSNTVAYSIKATQSVDAGVIFASADASFSEGVTYTHGDASTQSTTVSNIPLHRYGIIQIGNQMGVVKGTYYVTDTACRTVQRTWTIGIFPLREAAGVAGGYSSSPKPPWPQASLAR